MLTVGDAICRGSVFLTGERPLHVGWTVNCPRQGCAMWTSTGKRVFSELLRTPCSTLNQNHHVSSQKEHECYGIYFLFHIKNSQPLAFGPCQAHGLLLICMVVWFVWFCSICFEFLGFFVQDVNKPSPFLWGFKDAIDWFWITKKQKDNGKCSNWVFLLCTVAWIPQGN